MLSKNKLKQVLMEQRDAILRKSEGVERNILKILEQKIKLPHVIVLTGLRRSGKSTLLRQIIKKKYCDTNFYYINFEDERLFNFQAKDFNIIYETLIELFGECKTFFIDEIQNVSQFENFVRRFYDLGFKFFITGSSAKLLSKEIGTKLTGRHIDILLHPFSFKEYLALNNIKWAKSDLFKTNTRVKFKKHFSNFLLEGGMPEYSQYNDPEILVRIYEDVVLKDIVVRYSVENYKQLKDLYQYLITTVSQRFSYNSLKKFIKINSSNTIKKYIDYLKETYFISVINKFDYSLKKQIVNDKKIYVIDNGFISKIAIKFTNDFGWFLENLVFNVLKMQGEIFYYSDKFECDFILVNNNKVKSAVQVSWELNSINYTRELSGLLDALKKLKLKKGLILTNDQEDELIIEGKLISIKPVWKWLLE